MLKNLGIKSRKVFLKDCNLATALAEKLSALDTEKYLEERSKRGGREKYLNVLAKIKDREPQEFDR